MNKYDIIIIGAGPAGLTAAIYARRANKQVLVLEANSYGGQIVNAHTVENYPGIEKISGFDLATNMYNQAKNLGTEIKFETVLKIEENLKVTTNKETYQAKSIIIATGAVNRKLEVENEEKYIGKGVSYCASCDGNFYKKKNVAVIGGGNTALEDALYLANIASNVYLIHRRNNFKGEKKYINELKKYPNIHLKMNYNVTKLNGKEKLESINIKDENNKEETIEVSGVFIAVGQTPNNYIFKNIINLDKHGYIKSRDGVHTNKEKIYVAGDTRVKTLRQLTTAVSDGSIAATTAIREMED